MSLPQFFAQEALSNCHGRAVVTLASGEFHHVLVRRIASGEHIVLLGSDKTALEAVLVAYDDGSLTIDVVSHIEKVSAPEVVLYQGVSKGERMDMVMRAATEMGVCRIVPCITQRCVVRLENEERLRRRVERWQKIVRESVKQSGRIDIPDVTDPVDLANALQLASMQDCIICPWEEQRTGSLKQAIREKSPTSVAIFIGPEGGFSEEEALAVEAAGGYLVTLGPTILRTEHAGIIACALVLHEMGGLGNDLSDSSVR